MYQRGGSNGLRPQIMTKQWLALVRPVLEYGCELREGEISGGHRNSHLVSGKLLSVYRGRHEEVCAGGAPLSCLNSFRSILAAHNLSSS